MASPKNGERGRTFTRWRVVVIGGYVLLGGMCEALGQQTLAEKLYRCGLNYAVRKRADLFVEFFSGCIANTYCARGDTTTAIALLNQRLAENPRSASGYYDLAKVYLFIENKEAAIENYRKALELESDEEWKEIIRKQLAHLSS